MEPTRGRNGAAIQYGRLEEVPIAPHHPLGLGRFAKRWGRGVNLALNQRA